MLAGLTGWHLVIIVGVIILLFGATRLPQLARGLGQSLRILRTEVKDELDGIKHDDPPSESSKK